MEIDWNYIVCGRGQRNYNNDGNKVARHIVATRLARYMDESSGRNDKTKLVDTTTRWLLEMNMVFVKRSDDDRTWVKLCDATARSKVGHLFRDASRQARRCKGRKAASSTARVIKTASFSDETCLVCSPDDATSVLTDSDSSFNENIVSLETISPILAQPPRAIFCQQPKNQKDSTYAGIQRSHVPTQGACPGAMGKGFIKDELHFFAATRNRIPHELELRFDGSPNVLHLGDHMESKHGLSSPLLHDYDSCTLSVVEDFEDLGMLVASFNDFEVDPDFCRPYHFEF
jgi:hypothetical protein